MLLSALPRPSRALAAIVVLGGAALLYGACSSTATGVDACRQLESARCDKLASPTCNVDGSFPGDPESCSRFYETQCGRGLQDGASEPTSSQLTRCLAAIKNDCSVALDPLNAADCSAFLVAPGTVTADTGTLTDAADAADVADAAETDASVIDTTPPPDTTAAIDTALESGIDSGTDSGTDGATDGATE